MIHNDRFLRRVAKQFHLNYAISVKHITNDEKSSLHSSTETGHIFSLTPNSADQVVELLSQAKLAETYGVELLSPSSSTPLKMTLTHFKQLSRPLISIWSLKEAKRYLNETSFDIEKVKIERYLKDIKEGDLEATEEDYILMQSLYASVHLVNHFELHEKSKMLLDFSYKKPSLHVLHAYIRQEANRRGY